MDISKGFVSPTGERAQVIKGLSLVAEPGQFLVIVGPSGCGKTTLLRCVAGLLVPDQGHVDVAGRVVSGIPDGVAIVFQDYSKSLFPWLTLEDNVAFGLPKLSREEGRRRAALSLERVGLAEYRRHYPWQVSGGMQQRTAIARALVREADLVIFDEPFASVDALTRMALEDTLLELWTEDRFTAIFVTHDIDEAIYLADKVLVLSSQPTSVIKEIPVVLERPRDQVVTRGTESFQELRRLAMESLGLGGGARLARHRLPAGGGS